LNQSNNIVNVLESSRFFVGKYIIKEAVVQFFTELSKEVH